MGPMLPLLTGCPPPNANAWRRWRARWPRGTGKPWPREPASSVGLAFDGTMCAVFTPDAEGDSVARKPTPRQARRSARGRGKPRSRWSVAIACGWRTSSTARSSNSSSRAISASATSCLPRTKSPNATASRGRWCARRCCACAPTGWSQRIRGWAPRQPPARAQAQDLQRRGTRQRLSARAGGAGGAGRRCRAPGGPAPHRRAVAQDRGGAPGLRRIAGAGAHVGRG